jgi:hypothetical protein
MMRKATYIKKHKIKTGRAISSLSSESERLSRLSRLAAYLDATREQFANQVATANSRIARLRTGVLAGPIDRGR